MDLSDLKLEDIKDSTVSNKSHMIIMMNPESEMEEFIVTCDSMENLESLYNDIETEGGSDTIPDRSIPIYERRPLSQNTHYMLTREEAFKLLEDPRVLSIENVEFLNSVRKFNGYKQTSTFSRSSTYTSQNQNWKNWGLLRCTEGQERDSWGSEVSFEETKRFYISDNGYTGSQSPKPSPEQTSTISLGATGKNVDVIIMDGISGVPNHPEFAVNEDGSGGSRYNQYDWYQLQSIARGISGRDTSTGLLSGSYSYTGEDAGDSTHGSHTSGTTAGNTQGWARDANIYQINPLGSNQGIRLGAWDYVRAFHRSKPINPITGRKNPTICNCSYGNSLTLPTYYYDAAGNVIAKLWGAVEATRRSVKIGLYTNLTPLTSTQLNNANVKNITGSDGTVYSSVPYYSTSDNADIQGAIDDGIIIVGAAGNDGCMMDISTGPDWNNSVTSIYQTASIVSLFVFNHNRASPPCSVDSVITVGAADAIVYPKQGSISYARKMYFSNCGPKVDLYAPGTHIISSVNDSVGSGWGTPVQDPRNSNYYIGRDMGTSMASPQVCGVLACLLELYPEMNQAQAKNLITSYAKVNQIKDSTLTSPLWTSDTTSLQGGPNKYLYFPPERPPNGELYPKQNHKSRPISGILYPRRRVRIR